MFSQKVIWHEGTGHLNPFWLGCPVTRTLTVGNRQEITNYSYDGNGNQILKTQSVLETAGSGTAGASLQVSASEPVEFDATVSEYNGWNQQVKVTNDAGTGSYAYYPDGLRYSKTMNGALLRQVWDSTNLAYEYTLGEENAVVPVRRYARGINAIYVESGDAKSYYLYNAHGDVVQLTDAAGTVTQEYEYDAFGNEQNPSANDTNPLRYCGEYFDAETSTIYLRARYYDPSIGRFTSADTVLQIMVELSSGIEVPDPLSLNRYTYCHNNPVKYMDSTGNFVISTTVLLVAAGAAIVGTIGGFVDNYIQFLRKRNIVDDRLLVRRLSFKNHGTKSVVTTANGDAGFADPVSIVK